MSLFSCDWGLSRLQLFADEKDHFERVFKVVHIPDTGIGTSEPCRCSGFSYITPKNQYQSSYGFG